jgi:hypothetical protein
VQSVASRADDGKVEKISPQIVNNLEIMKETFVEMSAEIDQMHASFREQVDLLTKMYEKQQGDYNGFRNDIQ